MTTGNLPNGSSRAHGCNLATDVADVRIRWHEGWCDHRLGEDQTCRIAPSPTVNGTSGCLILLALVRVVEARSWLAIWSPLSCGAILRSTV